MLVLLVSERDVLVDETGPLADGSPPTALTFTGPPVEGAGGRLEQGPALVYRLAGTADLSAALIDRVEGELAEALRPVGQLPVYLELAPSTAEAFLAAQEAAHPSVGHGIPRPRLQLVDATDDEPEDQVPTFSPDGLAAALVAWPAGITEGMRIRIVGTEGGRADGEFLVSQVRPTEPGKVEVDLVPADLSGVDDTVVSLLAEARRAREEAAMSDGPTARRLLDAAAGYERRAHDLTVVSYRPAHT